MKSILKLRLSTFSEVCGTEFKEAVFTSREWNLLQEMKDILAPFAEATEMTEGRLHDLSQNYLYRKMPFNS